jgi:hypothetical protein
MLLKNKEMTIFAANRGSALLALGYRHTQKTKLNLAVHFEARRNPKDVHALRVPGGQARLMETQWSAKIRPEETSLCSRGKVVGPAPEAAWRAGARQARILFGEEAL